MSVPFFFELVCLILCLADTAGDSAKILWFFYGVGFDVAYIKWFINLEFLLYYEELKYFKI